MQAIVATRDFHRSARRIPCVECVEDSDGGAAFQERYEEEHEEAGEEREEEKHISVHVEF